MFMMYLMQDLRWKRAKRAQQNLETAIRQFPKNPVEYNDRQMEAFRTGEGWRRFNYRNLAILAGTSISLPLVMRWHHRRQEMLAKRKTLIFWMWTLGAGLAGSVYGVYLIRKHSSPPILKQITRNPTARGFLYISVILVVALAIYAYLLSERRSRRQKILEAWRRKKHQQMMYPKEKAPDPMEVFNQPVEMDSDASPAGKSPANLPSTDHVDHDPATLPSTH